MRWFLLLFLLVALDLYVFQAVRQLFQPLPANWRQIVYVLYWVVPAVAIGFLFWGPSAPTTDRAQAIFQFTRALLIGIYIAKFLAVPLLLIDDLRRGFNWAVASYSDTPFSPSRSRFMSTAGVLMGGIPFVALVYGMVRNPYRYKVFRSRISLPGLPEGLRGLRIVQISDIHTGSFTFKEPVREAVKMINDLRPDLVLFTGDLVNDETSEAEDFVDVFDKIRAKYGVFSVLGNHDYGDYREWPSREAKAENLRRMKAIHREMGWQLLNNEHRIVPVNGEKVAVIGVENFSAKDRFPKYGNLEAACRDCDQEAGLRLLLSHDPSHWEYEVVPKFPEIDITFSGHTHGMQFGVEIPGWVKWSPIKYMYRQWAGLYQQGRQYLYVNRGLGFIGYPGRVGILPEITCLELT